jgi:hypothetical protein
MNRRSFISTLLAAPVAVKAIAALTSVGPFGFVDIERWHSLGLFGGHGVFLNGVEVTNGATWFNDLTGEVGRHVMLDDRTFALDENGDPAMEVLKGEVVVRQVEPYTANHIEGRR